VLEGLGRGAPMEVYTSYSIDRLIYIGSAKDEKFD
jgi:hypothetical protein